MELWEETVFICRMCDWLMEAYLCFVELFRGVILLVKWSHDQSRGLKPCCLKYFALKAAD